MRGKLYRTGLSCLMLTMMVSMTGLLSCPGEQPQSLLIIDAMAMTPQQQCSIRPTGGGGGDEVSAGGGQVIRPYGVLDLAFTNVYWLFPRYLNLLPSLQSITGEGPTSLTPLETNYLSVYKALTKVEISKEFVTTDSEWMGTAGFPDNQPEFEFWSNLLNTYQNNWVQSIVASSASPASEGTVAVQVVKPELGNHMADRMDSWIKGDVAGVEQPGYWLTTKIMLKGLTQDMKEITSNQFWFPIEICWCCLCLCDTNVPDIPGSTEVPCVPGQDDGVPVTLWGMMADDPTCCWEKCGWIP